MCRTIRILDSLKAKSDEKEKKIPDNSQKVRKDVTITITKIRRIDGSLCKVLPTE